MQTNGGSIRAGDTGVSSGTPEPGTFALALLAAGAAGVLAWRRRKQPVAE
ncbi:MAG: PEP-CTERM sorting domain-containing protein [Acidobacteriia bacterium]|nr:PEP-CTERM sorting domain-containing protein [Terriglobia bacterium]